MVEIVHGKAVRLTDRVRRITAPNAGAMTGPGTNTYLVGHKDVAVIDPGPADQSHIDAILESCGRHLRWILVTHTHPDHSPAAIALAAATGAKIMGNKLEHNDGFQDDSFAPEQAFEHDDCLRCDEFSVRVIHTPGHVDNHLCFLIEEDGLLLTGDHIMQGSTVVIIPPHGDMKKYIDSLQLLLDYPIKALGPGHGLVIDTPVEEIQGIIEHRLGREAKVISVLKPLPHSSIENLTPAVYDDVDPSLHPIATYSLLAHLLKLEQERRATRNGDKWSFIQ
jgi:glyoxylase-like metal-dependent hydrolase (beta-lactamase superfamily II)